MDEKKNIRLCTVKLPEKLHRKMKLTAFKEGMTLQSWILYVLEESLEALENEAFD
jgi:predicted HicB family RNase H-like nuclease